jgi:[acyl-carrier-protein] S-malonyltransferase
VPAFVFPGQGSQKPGMGRAWRDHPSWELVTDASEAAGRDLAWLLLDADADILTETRHAQLATFTISLLVLDAVERLGIEPTACAGHSVGEYAALVAAGAIGFDDGVRVVAERGEAMQAAADARPGIMALVQGSDAETVDIACRLADGEVWVANVNTPSDVVIAGTADAVGRAGDHARRLGARRVTQVPVGGAFHTPFMAPARDRLRKALASVVFHEPDMPIVANVDGLPHLDAPELCALLLAQLVSPVRWRRSVLHLAGLLSDDPTRGVAPAERIFVEVGPGGSLSRMVRETVPAAETVAVAVPDDLDRLVDVVAGDATFHRYVAGHHGEQLYVSERMVISPAAGVFEPANPAPAGTIEVGTVIGAVSGAEVRSPFAGTLMGMLAHQGERLQAGQPVAWLRTGEAG